MICGPASENETEESAIESGNEIRLACVVIREWETQSGGGSQSESAFRAEKNDASRRGIFSQISLSECMLSPRISSPPLVPSGLHHAYGLRVWILRVSEPRKWLNTKQQTNYLDLSCCCRDHDHRACPLREAFRPPLHAFRSPYSAIKGSLRHCQSSQCCFEKSAGSQGLCATKSNKAKRTQINTNIMQYSGALKSSQGLVFGITLGASLFSMYRRCSRGRCVPPTV